jgi:hypothetical protein
VVFGEKELDQRGVVVEVKNCIFMVDIDMSMSIEDIESLVEVGMAIAVVVEPMSMSMSIILKAELWPHSRRNVATADCVKIRQEELRVWWERKLEM